MWNCCQLFRTNTNVHTTRVHSDNKLRYSGFASNSRNGTERKRGLAVFESCFIAPRDSETRLRRTENALRCAGVARNELIVLDCYASKPRFKDDLKTSAVPTRSDHCWCNAIRGSKTIGSVRVARAAGM